MVGATEHFGPEQSPGSAALCREAGGDETHLIDILVDRVGPELFKVAAGQVKSSCRSTLRSVALL